MATMRLSWLLLVSLVAAVFLVEPASAAPPVESKGVVAISGAGVGIAPSAPAYVREHVNRVKAGITDEADVPTRALQRSKRAAWIGCRTVWAYRGASHTLGYVLFRYYEQVSWCSNGFGIYSYGRDRWPEVNAGWRFDGHIGSSITGNHLARSAWTQGSFAFCLASTCVYRYPWVTIRVSVDGTWTANYGG